MRWWTFKNKSMYLLPFLYVSCISSTSYSDTALRVGCGTSCYIWCENLFTCEMLEHTTCIKCLRIILRQLSNSHGLKNLIRFYSYNSSSSNFSQMLTPAAQITCNLFWTTLERNDRKRINWLLSNDTRRSLVNCSDRAAWDKPNEFGSSHLSGRWVFERRGAKPSTHNCDKANSSTTACTGEEQVTNSVGS